MMTGFGLTGFFLMLLFWVILILLAAWLIKALFSMGRNDTTQKDQPNAKEILDQRYARGDITREQYEKMKSDMQI